MKRGIKFVECLVMRLSVTTIASNICHDGHLSFELIELYHISINIFCFQLPERFNVSNFLIYLELELTKVDSVLDNNQETFAVCLYEMLQRKNNNKLSMQSLSQCPN